MRIAITGATGFLGSHLTRKLLQEGRQVLALGRNTEMGARLKAKGAEFVQADLSELPKLVKAFEGCDRVVHCAALSSPWGSLKEFHRCNVAGTAKVLQATQETRVARLIHISSPSIYFSFAHRTAICEEAPLPGTQVNHYSRTKLEAEKLVDQASADGLGTIILRPRALFGPGDTVLLPRLLEANQRLGIPRSSRNPVITDLTYIDNAVDAIELALEAPQSCLGKAYNITNGDPQQLHKLLEYLFNALDTSPRFLNIPYPLAHGIAWIAEGLGTLLGREPPLTRYSLGVLSYSLTLDISRAQKELGYQASVGVYEGIDRFVEWWEKENGHDSL